MQGLCDCDYQLKLIELLIFLINFPFSETTNIAIICVTSTVMKFALLKRKNMIGTARKHESQTKIFKNSE